MRRLRTIFLVLLLLACLVLAHIPVVRNTLTRCASLGQELSEYGWASGPAFAALVAALVIIGVPRLALCSFAGLTFGFLRGLLWTQVGTLIGSFGAFCFVRWAGRDLIMRKWPALERYAQRLGSGGWATVLLARLMPMNTLLVDAALALTPVTRREFVLASAVGLLPEAIPATLIGAGIAQATLGGSIAYVLVGAVLLALCGFFIMNYCRRPGVREKPNLTNSAEGCPDTNAPPESRPLRP